MKTSRYFTEAEFQRCNPPCSIEDMEQSFLDWLDDVREEAGIPFVLNCAYRSSAHDKSKGRSGNSAHCYGLAADIRCNASATRYKIIAAALKLGASRIGVGHTFIHLDTSHIHTQNVIWDYAE